MKIKKLICSKARTGFYFDDQKAIKLGAKHDGSFYVGKPVTEHFTSIRQPGEAVSIMLVLEDGQLAHGDCCAVQYSGAGGRDPLFLADKFLPIIQNDVAKALEGKELNSFRELAEMIDKLKVNGERLHTAIRYGVSQAILDAVAKASKLNLCDVIAKEYGCEVSDKMVDIFTQSGDDRFNNADKMILKAAPVLPHGLFNSLEKLGSKGEHLKEYVAWLKKRTVDFAPYEGYRPILHLDCYGTIGLAFGHDNYKGMADFLEEIAEIAKPLHVRIEGPMDSDERAQQIKDLAGLTKELDDRHIDVEIVADEWCNTLEDVIEFADNRAGHMIQVKTPDLGSIHNTIEAILYCKKKNIGAYQGGSCNETERSAQISIQMAMATRACQILAKPGMGVDEAFMIAYNEMQRILVLRKNGIGVYTK